MSLPRTKFILVLVHTSSWKSRILVRKVAIALIVCYLWSSTVWVRYVSGCCSVLLLIIQAKLIGTPIKMQPYSSFLRRKWELVNLVFHLRIILWI